VLRQHRLEFKNANLRIDADFLELALQHFHDRSIQCVVAGHQSKAQRPSAFLANAIAVRVTPAFLIQ
jgi:hypothetical protein